MTLPQFTTSPICRGGTICSACRDKENGRALRSSLAAAYSLPEGAPDFACPEGKGWAADGSPQPAPAPAESAKPSGCGCKRNRPLSATPPTSDSTPQASP